MGRITVETCPIEGLKVITPAVFGDERGYFMETYNYNDFKEAGIDLTFVQDNQSSSRKGVLRGLHFQINHPQVKIVRVVSGEVFDVAVDLRPGSPTFGRYFGITLSEENKKMVYIPEGFGHGCLALEENTTFYYLCSQDYQPGYDTGIRWDDETLHISWPLDRIEKVIVSEKDRNLGSFLDMKEKLLKGQ